MHKDLLQKRNVLTFRTHLGVRNVLTFRTHLGVRNVLTFLTHLGVRNVLTFRTHLGVRNVLTFLTHLGGKISNPSRGGGYIKGQNICLHGVLCFIPVNLICNVIF